MKDAKGGDRGGDLLNTGRDSHSQIYARVKEAIIFNRLPPGQQINIQKLGQQFGVSEIPARDALIRLAHEELIEHQPNRGYFTKPLTVKKFVDHYEMAFLLLSHAIDVGASSFTIEGLRQPAAFGGPSSEPQEDTVRSKVLFIERLFERIAVLSGNKMILSTIRRFNDHTTFIRELDLEEAERGFEVDQYIVDLIDMLGSGNREDAIANLRRQLARKRKILAELVMEGNNRGWQTFDE